MLTLVEQDLVLQDQVEEEEVDNKDQVELVIQHTRRKVNLALLILVVEVEPEDQAVVVVLEQEVVDQGQLSLDSQDHQDLEYQ